MIISIDRMTIINIKIANNMNTMNYYDINKTDDGINNTNVNNIMKDLSKQECNSDTNNNIMKDLFK